MSALSENSLWGSMSDAQQKEALSLAITKKVPKRATLLELGEDGSNMILIQSGTCKVCLYTASGKEIILDYLGPLQVVGEISLFDEQPRTASVIAVEPCTISIFHRRDLLAFLEKNPDVALRFIQVLCGRLRRTNRLLESDRSFAMGPKLARGLLQLLEDHGVTQEEGRHLRFPISQTDLGNFVSLSRENVNRQLRDWQEDGILDLKSGKMYIQDMDALQEIADFVD